VVVECTGNPDGLALAARTVRPRGTIVLKSTYHGEARLDASRLVVNEVTLVGSRCGPFPRALEVLAARGIDVAALVHARFPLREGLRAFDEAARPGALKVLLDCA
jgi:threonine dehydrogenase-like Zn-dependent dehydrogenase